VHRAVRTPILLYVLALAVRLVVGAGFPDPAYPDSAYYVDVARQLAAGHGLNIDFVWIFPEVGGSIPANPVLPIPSNAHWMPLASIVMAPFMWVLGPTTLARYAGRILNIHPGPLPRFGGEGMYGRRVHEAVLAAGVAESGIVIHLVDEEYDHGAPIARAVVPIIAGDTAADLEARVRAAEPGFFVETLKQLSRGELSLSTG